MRPSGENHTISGTIRGQESVVTIAEVAAALRAFTVDGVDVVQRYPDDARPSLGAGIVMVPWPNRIDGGRWTLDGVTHQLDLSEVAKNNAIHGLLRSTAYRVADRTPGAIELTATIFAPDGYPFVVESGVGYTITADGLEVRHTLRNHSGTVAPVAVGTHPYFCIGGVDTADLVLACPADSVYVDDERSLPVRREAVAGPTDLRAGRRVGDLHLDHCFTDLASADGRSVTSLTAPDGRTVEVWTDPSFAYQVLLTTTDFIAPDGRPTLAVAIEPQTAAVDAFNSGDGVRLLAPGEEWTVSWGVVPDLRPEAAR